MMLGCAMKIASILGLGIFCALIAIITASIVGSHNNNFQYDFTREDAIAYSESVINAEFSILDKTGHCEPFTRTECSDVIPYGTSIFVPDDSSQTQMAANLENSLFLLRVASSKGDCDVALYSFLCAKAFPRCSVSSDNIVSTTKPCYPLCKRFNETCPYLVDRFNLIYEDLRPICADPSDTNCGLHVSPYLTSADVVVPVPLECPSPLVIPDDNNPSANILEGVCAEPCPILMWSRKEYRAMDIVSEVLGILSVLTSGFLTLTWLVFPKLRQRQYIFWFFLCSFFLSLFLWIGIRLRGSDVAASVHCQSNTMEYQMGGYCLWEGMTTIFFYIAGTAWWTLQSVDVFIKVVLEVRVVDGSRTDLIREIIYHVFAWGFGAVCLIGALAFKQIGGYGIGASFCLFSTKRSNTPLTPDVSYGFFYYPLIVMCCIGLLAISATFIKLIIFKFSTKSGLTMQTFIRIFMLVITMMGVFVIILIYKFMAADRLDQWKASSEEFYTCLLFAQDNQFETIDCGTAPKERMPLALKFLYDLIPFAPGLLVFLCYGFQKEIYTVWFGLFYDKCGIKACKKYSTKDEEHHTNVESTHASQTNATSSQAGSTATAAGSTTGAATKKSGLFKGGAYAQMRSKPASAAPSGVGSTAESTTEMTSVAPPPPADEDEF